MGEQPTPGRPCASLRSSTMESSSQGTALTKPAASLTGSSRTPGEPAGERMATTGSSGETEAVESTSWSLLPSARVPTSWSLLPFESTVDGLIMDCKKDSIRGGSNLCIILLLIVIINFNK